MDKFDRDKVKEDIEFAITILLQSHDRGNLLISERKTLRYVASELKYMLGNWEDNPPSLTKKGKQ